MISVTTRIVIALAFILLTSSPAVACPDGYYEECVFGLCGCIPNGGTVTRAVTRPFTESAIVSTGATLAGWIAASRATSIANSSPIPPAIRVRLAGYIDEAILDRARYQVDDHGLINFGALTLNFNDNVGAITLDDVIIFRNANDALSNPSLWAHELTHVKQYRDWGVMDFAISYIRDPNGIENPAYDKQNGFADWAEHVDRRSSREIAAAMPQQTWPIYVSSTCDRSVLLAVRWVPHIYQGKYEAWLVPAMVRSLRLTAFDAQPIQAAYTSMYSGTSDQDAYVSEWGHDDPDRPLEQFTVGNERIPLHKTNANLTQYGIELSIEC